MDACNAETLIRRRYREVFGAEIVPTFGTFVGRPAEGGCTAALGYRRAGEAPLFLEAYLDDAIEIAVGRAFGKPVARAAIIEIGNFAAETAQAMIGLWSAAANDLGQAGDVAVATLTLPLRRMFARLGVPIVVLADAQPGRIGGRGQWGNYYELEPQVCAGWIDQGQKALAEFQALRAGRKAA